MGFREDIEKARSNRDTFFAEHYASPLRDEDRASFAGLDYFPPAVAWRFEVRLGGTSPGKVDIPSSNGSSSHYSRVGWATVLIGDAEYTLDVLDDGDGGAFIPFADETNGIDTYAGGRYVGLVVDDQGRAWVDFNDARNPYCAYDDEFVCPLPPPSNRIDVPITAGEKDYRPIG